MSSKDHSKNPPQPPAKPKTPGQSTAETPVPVQPAAESPTTPAPPANPATLKQKIVLSLFLIVIAVVALFAVGMALRSIDETVRAEVSVHWGQPEEIKLAPGPATFRYDPDENLLIHRGIIDAERKLELRSLFQIAESINDGGGTSPIPAAGTEDEHLTATASGGVAMERESENDAADHAVVRMESLRDEYNIAIDDLAYLAAENAAGALTVLLVLGTFGGVLGAVLRSLVDFVGHACYTRQLDLSVWWPLYVTRPIVGGILGLVLIVLFKGQLFVSEGAQQANTEFWWLGVAVLGGFSTVDVTLRMRLTAKALFGVSGSSGKGGAGSGSAATNRQQTSQEQSEGKA